MNQLLFISNVQRGFLVFCILTCITFSGMFGDPCKVSLKASEGSETALVIYTNIAQCTLYR